MIDFPIDAVYTWTDLAAPEAPNVPAASARANRFRDLGTLRWSIRGLLRFAPWLRTVFVATDGRVPPGLPADPRIRVVPHDAFFRHPEDLPTYSSYAIEANLGFLPGLAEHFVYLNDDMFVGRPLDPSELFEADGRAICRFEDPLPGRGPLARLYSRLRGDQRLRVQLETAHLAEQVLGLRHPAVRRRRWLRSAHQAAPARASALRSLWDHPRLGPRLRRVSARRFRGWGDVCPFSLMALVACHQGLARAAAPLPNMLVCLRDDRLDDDAPFRRLLAQRPALFCVNDDLSDHLGPAATARVEAFLGAYFAPLDGAARTSADKGS